MTCQQITRTLLASRYRRNFVLPRYKPAGWWECDVFEVTASGRFREYEIKTSLADFRADAKKVKDEWWCRRHKTTAPRKYDNVRSVKGPAQFWYVCPEGLLSVEIVPEWAGLIECYKTHPRGHCYERELKKAPRLHSEQCDPKVVAHARGVCYWRLLNIFTSTTRNDYEIQTEAESAVVPSGQPDDPDEETAAPQGVQPATPAVEPPVRARVQRVEGWPRVRL